MPAATHLPAPIQMELPLDAFKDMAARLFARARGLCVLHLDMTLGEYHRRWYALVDVYEEVCASAIAASTESARRAKDATGRQRRQAREEQKAIDDILHDAQGVIEGMFLEATEPILKASAELHPPDEEEWYANTISNERACEHLGGLTLRQIIEDY